MRRETRISLALLGAAAFCFGLAGSMHRPLLARRQAYNLELANPLEDSPPLIAFTTVALGSFRGVLTDILWLRVSQLQEEGKYFEIVQLSDWITKLEPRFDAVWGFHAWNMAYNVSVLLHRPEDRWRWVRHGIRLLRDEGLTYNPGSARLYWELGWLFQHKVGAAYDSAHAYYKRAWAEEMTALLGDGYPDYPTLLDGNRGETVRKIVETYKLLPDVMREIDETYGPLDWRLPETHAFYWAWRGRPHAEGFDAVHLDRMMYQSMRRLFEAGQLRFEPEENLYARSPAWRLLDAAIAVYESALAAHPDQSSFQAGYCGFLTSARDLALAEDRQERVELLRHKLAAYCDVSPAASQPRPALAFGPRDAPEPLSAKTPFDEPSLLLALRHGLWGISYDD